MGLGLPFHLIEETADMFKGIVAKTAQCVEEKLKNRLNNEIFQSRSEAGEDSGRLVEKQVFKASHRVSCRDCEGWVGSTPTHYWKDC